MDEIVFRNLGMNEKIDALTSGIASQFPKAFIFYQMKPGRKYTPSEIYAECINYLDGETPFYFSSVEPAFKKSIVKTGLVRRKDEDRKQKYEKSGDGNTYGDVAILRALVASQKIDLSFTKIIGNPQSRGTYKRSYSVAKTLDVISTLDEYENITVQKIADQAKCKVTTIRCIIDELKRNNLIETNSIEFDQKITGYFNYKLKDEIIAEKYLFSKELLRKDSKKIRPNFRDFGYLYNVLGYVLKNKEATCNDINNIDKSKVSSALTILSDLDILEKPDVQARFNIKLKEKGEVLYQILYKPVLEITENINDIEKLRSWSSIIDEYDDNEIEKMFRFQHNLYKIEKRTRSHDGALKKEEQIIEVILNNIKSNKFAKEDLWSSLDNSPDFGSVRTVYRTVNNLVTKNVILHNQRGIYELPIDWKERLKESRELKK